MADTLAGKVVLVLDAVNLRTIAETEVGPGPYTLAALEATGRVFVALTGSDEVAVLDAAGRRSGVTALGGLGFPQGLAADEAGQRVYAIYSLAPRYRQIAVLDGETGAVVQHIPATLDRPLSGAEALAVIGAAGDPGSRLLLVGAAEGVLTFDLISGQWREAFPAHGPAPIFGIAADGRRRIVYLASPGDRAGAPGKPQLGSDIILP